MNRLFLEPFRKLAAAGGASRGGRCLINPVHWQFNHGNISPFMSSNALLPSSVEDSESLQISGKDFSPPLYKRTNSQSKTHNTKNPNPQRFVDSIFPNFSSLSPHLSSSLHRMTILIPQREFASEAESQSISLESDELVLDGGFVNPESLPNDAAFFAPKINSFGHSFRDYDAESERQKTVEELYRLNHINQTYDFVKRMREEYGKLDKTEMSIWECCEMLNEVVDDSDPDLDEPQIQHLLQSAEAIRKDYPNEDWLHLTALIHDLGKVLLLPAFGGLPQWAVVGDTYPLGCAFDKSIVHHKYFKDNVDNDDPNYNTKYGIYSPGCGLDNVVISWGHDDYMYLVAKENGTTLPHAGLFIIRYHSFYPLHKEGAYQHLMNEEDVENLKWLHIFNKYDLYSKSKVLVDVEKVKPYYQSLIQKYFPSKLKW
ncbi:inositol oxygenase 2 [Benincasa hispida]|uniref:inositol oxygenase 2 n=1 Tax=Benincasa hispida TaxID=102211 RepID=UPI0018FF471E|nr:inositol oxygenase 2 [Benincasa hispida]